MEQIHIWIGCLALSWTHSALYFEWLCRIMTQTSWYQGKQNCKGCAQISFINWSHVLFWVNSWQLLWYSSCGNKLNRLPGFSWIIGHNPCLYRMNIHYTTTAHRCNVYNLDIYWMPLFYLYIKYTVWSKTFCWGQLHFKQIIHFMYTWKVFVTCQTHQDYVTVCSESKHATI